MDGLFYTYRYNDYLDLIKSIDQLQEKCMNAEINKQFLNFSQTEMLNQSRKNDNFTTVKF